jgi:hypothetical protein
MLADFSAKLIAVRAAVSLTPRAMTSHVSAGHCLSVGQRRRRGSIALSLCVGEIGFHQRHRRRLQPAWTKSQPGMP